MSEESETTSEPTIRINPIPESLPMVKIHNLFWDGKHLGDIDNHISISVINEVNTFMLWVDAFGFRKQIPIKIQSYKSDVPLIAEELKFLFNLSLSGFLRCRYKTKECLISHMENDIPIRHFQKSYNKALIEDIRNIFAFRYLSGFKSSSENSITIRSFQHSNFQNKVLKNEMITKYYAVADCNDSGIDNNCGISDEILNKWFQASSEDDFENLDETSNGLEKAELLEYHVEKLVHYFYSSCNSNIDTMKSEIDKIFSKYDPKLLIWSFVVIERMKRYV
jgi:hypothetical protein